MLDTHSYTFLCRCDIVPEAVLGILRLLPFALHLTEKTTFSVANDLLSEIKDIFDKSLRDSYLKNYEPTEAIPMDLVCPFRVPPTFSC